VNGLLEVDETFEGVAGALERRGGWGAAPAVPSPIKEHRIVIVDDSACSRAALTALLSTVPHAQVVGTAGNGIDAVRLVDESAPDVVLMDVRMPGMDGVEATRQIKASHPDTKVILLTVCAAYREVGLAAGADRFLVKGGPVEELVEAINAAVTLPSDTPTDDATLRDDMPGKSQPGFSASLLVGRMLLRLGYPV
jgi:DNA-binding NarL/FixJ family response regulator